MKYMLNGVKRLANRRSFFTKGLAAGAATASVWLNSSPLFGQQRVRDQGEDGHLTKGDAAILSFLAAAEILESDLWEQYWELGSAAGVTSGFEATNPATGTKPTPTGGNAQYTAALQVLDGDMPQYITDNTDDEFSHANFLLAYLKSNGVNTSALDLLVGPHFRTLHGSVAMGSTKKGRLTNLTQLTVDTSYWTRYRSSANNPDLDPAFIFPQAIPSLSKGQFPAIPRDNTDLTPKDHIQAIANTAGFHFGFIEQGGTSLYPSLAQRVTSREVLRILLSIGPTETQHFQTWQDKAGNAPPLTDPTNPSLVFPDLNSPPFGGENFQTNLIMPEPCPFLSRKFPVCSIIRPTQTKGAAMGAARALTADGLFIGQSAEFFQLLQDLAAAADAATPDD